MEKLRKNINEIDIKLIKLLEQRFEVASKIVDYKKEHNLPILDEKREKLLFEFYNEHNKTLNKTEILEILQVIITKSKQIQAKKLNKE